MRFDIYLFFNGNCREAVSFYADVFKTDPPEISTYGDMPPDHEASPNDFVTEESKDLVMHTSLYVNGNALMFSDVLPGMQHVVGNNFSITISSDNMDEIRTLFNRLKEGGSVEMDLQETFWSKAFGMLTDKFGVNWQITYDGGE